MAFENQQEGSGRHDGCDDVCDGFCIEGGSSSPEEGKQDGQQAVVCFSEHGQKEGGLRASDSRKAIDKGILCADGDHSKGIHMNSPDG